MILWLVLKIAASSNNQSSSLKESALHGFNFNCPLSLLNQRRFQARLKLEEKRVAIA